MIIVFFCSELGSKRLTILSSGNIWGLSFSLFSSFRIVINGSRENYE